MSIPNLEELNLSPADVQIMSANYLRDSFENDIKHLKQYMRSRGLRIEERRTYIFKKYKGDPHDSLLQLIGTHIEFKGKNQLYVINKDTLDHLSETIRCINQNLSVTYNVVKYEGSDDEEDKGDMKIVSMTILRIIE